jgi:hypothetical protein
VVAAAVGALDGTDEGATAGTVAEEVRSDVFVGRLLDPVEEGTEVLGGRTLCVVV